MEEVQVTGKADGLHDHGDQQGKDLQSHKESQAQMWCPDTQESCTCCAVGQGEWQHPVARCNRP